ncbi:YndM family protein [Salinithrix halophila]|uniref:YndM family protein n=1 Tax=Salinithrix halophila TaxID=1485204 RepID=A0ABV8JD53_9BACL
MRHLLALLIKFAATTVVLFIILSGFYDVSFTDVFLTSVVLTAIGYLGDLLILPRTGNFIASMGDFGLALIVVWFMGTYRFDEEVPLFGPAFLSAVVIAFSEWFFHKYMKNAFMEKEAIG